MTPLSSAQPIRVLLVDDDRSWSEFTADLLRDCGPLFALTYVADFDSAVEGFAAGTFDVALVDYRLGARTGVELLRTAEVQNADVPVIMLTSDARVDGEALAAGAVDYLVKTELTAPMLQRALRYAVERHRTSSQQAHLASIVESSADAIFSRSLEGHLLSWNNGAERLYGYQASEIIGRHVSMLLASEDRAALPSILGTIIAGACIQQRELNCVHKDGRIFPVLMTISPTRDRRGRVVGAATVAHDISESRKTQRELDHIFNLSPDMLCTSNYEGYFTRTNATWQRVLGYRAEDLQQQPFLSFVHPDDHEITIAEMSRLAEGETTFGFTNRYRTKAGDYRWIEWHAKADTASRLIYAVARDQTEHRLLEQQLRQAQKMEAVGQLAGGVAHDFNNILTAITGFSEFVLERVAPGDPIEPDVHQILKACDRAGALTRQLLAFSRKQILAPEVLDIGAVVSRMTAMLGRIIGEDIELAIRTPPGLGLVNADRGQLEQVLLNLAVNARDAMPSGGKLLIEVANVTLDRGFATRHPGSSAGPHVMLGVSDTGCGMTEQVRARLFEPFFTTKELGKGTGLGLATVYGIVKQSGGSIWVYSEPGIGSTFKIYLPRTDAAPTADADSSSSPERLDGIETVLVVEDQVEVRQVVQMTLERRGYRVLQAAGAAEAEAKLVAHGAPIAMLLTDVVMPQMSGSALAARLQRHQPNLRVLFMSGYTDDAVVRHGVLTRDAAFLEKPFTATGLLRAVRRVLDAR
jgi:two-component system cell cycle sensor histidine kinase/response regulator CckA